MNTDGCKMDCSGSEPNCAVVCPEHGCAHGNCAKCKTECSKPLCKLKCPQAQNCEEVCEEPMCDWDCKAPERGSKECPTPKCKMECEMPHDCSGSSTYKDLPAIKGSEFVVRSFETPAPASLLQLSVGENKAKAPSMQ